MKKVIILINLISLFSVTTIKATEEKDYSIYHQRVVEAEILIVSQNHEDALQVYEELFENYDFIFVREYQIATQLALYLDDEEKAYWFLVKGIRSGWQMKSIRRNAYLAKLRATKEWKTIKKQYRNFNEQYASHLNESLRNRVKKIFSKDQWKAIGALFRFSSKAQDRYAEKKFAPQSEKQIAEFSEILKVYGYPGEKLIGNDFWMSTIVSHHNSISQAYNKKDTLYPKLRPQLKDALKKGQISPFEFASIDDWYRSTKSDKDKSTYGILDAPTRPKLAATNELRKRVYLRPIEIRNELIEVQKKTGMDFYLNGDPWIESEIEIRE